MQDAVLVAICQAPQQLHHDTLDLQGTQQRNKKPSECKKNKERNPDGIHTKVNTQPLTA